MIKDSLLGSSYSGKKEYSTSLVDKILSCCNNVNAVSAAKMLGCSKGYVYYVWKYYGFPVKKINYHRTYRGFFEK